MSELKACPFCGKEQLSDKERGDTIPYKEIYFRLCDWCGVGSSHWNIRPIEDAQAQEIERLKDYCMRLLSDDSRLWHCQKCGVDFSGGAAATPTAETLCPMCEVGIAVPKVWIMQDEIERLRKALEDILDHSNHYTTDNQATLFYIEQVAREALEVK